MIITVSSAEIKQQQPPPVQGRPVFAMVNMTSSDWAAHARLDLMVIGAMWMERLTVTTKILIIETLFLCHRVLVEQQQPTAPGVSEAAGAAALPPVEEGHNMLQEIWQNRQQVGVNCARGHL